MVFNHIILATLWMVYCALHSVLASGWFKKKIRRRMEHYKWYRLWYTLFAFVFLIAVLYYQTKISTIEIFQFRNWIFIPGMIVSILGLALMFVCIRKYFMNLSGLRSLFIENFSNKLQVTGIHKYIRHPLYLGTFMFIWGLFLCLPYLSLLVMNIVVTMYTLVGIEWEEQKLVMEFGDDYRKYRSKVPKLIPFFKLKRKL